ncbi:MAG: beta-galactosidase [Patescibacteria group bacterium]
MKGKQKIMFLILAAVVIIAAFVVFWVLRANAPANGGKITWGVSFSGAYAGYFDLDWRQTYTDILDDLKVRALRIPAYWEEIEPSRGNYQFADLDWQLLEAKKRNAFVILAIGRKLPRWPECHLPEWAKKLNEEEQDRAALAYLSKVVSRYKSYSSIRYWQVENEPFFPFGEKCKTISRDFLKKEIALVKSLDNRPVVITDSGELSSWIGTASLADILGISMYRVSWNKLFGYLFYPVFPAFYRERANLIKYLVSDVIVTELQVEPWAPTDIKFLPLEEQYKSMNLERFRDNIEFARRAGFTEVYLWGVEWWYWLKVRGNDTFWNESKKLFIE